MLSYLCSDSIFLKLTFLPETFVYIIFNNPVYICTIRQMLLGR
jgi:hypothetical protein